MKAIDGYQEMPESKAKKIIETDIRKRIFEYNRDQFKQVRSQQRPVDLGFSRQQWFDTEEAFERVSPTPQPIIISGSKK